MGTDLNLFGWPLLCLLVATPSLGLIGAQVMGRQQALQVLCIAQGAILGNILAIWLNLQSTWILAWAMAVGVSVFCDRLNKMPSVSRNSFNVSLYVILLSMTYLVVSFVPSIESHAINQFFGDVALVSTEGAKILFGISLAVLGLMITFFIPLTKLSFEIMILDTRPKSSSKRWLNALFKMGLTLYLTLVIHYLGLLYCLGALTIIPLILAQRNTSLSSYFRGILFVSIASSFFGFLSALHIDNISTTPVINISFLLFAFILRFFLSCLRNYR